jgi:vacuolar-type H+-ATPase subunit I/STV1
MPMRRGDRNSSEEAEPLVRGDMADLDAQIGQRLASARELTSRLVQSQDEIDMLRADFYNWDEYNEQLLRSRFSSNKIANEYKRVTFGIGNAPSSAIELTWLREDIGTQARKLESLRQKLELFSPRSAQLQPCAHLVGSRSEGSGL